MVGRQHFGFFKKMDAILHNFNSRIITSTSINIEYKGREAYNIWDYAHYLNASNHEWPLRIEATDRRFVVIDTTEKIPDAAHFTTLTQEVLDDEGLESYFRYLTNLDLYGFNIKNRPVTAAHFEMKLQSATPVPGRPV